jgi:hypothetical protein
VFLKIHNLFGDTKMKRIFLYILILIAFVSSLHSQEIMQRNLYDYAPDQRLWSSYVLDYVEGNKLFVYTTLRLNESEKLKVKIINALGDSIKFFDSEKIMKINDIFVENNGNIKIVGNVIIYSDGFITHTAFTFIEFNRELNVLNEISSDTIPYVNESFKKYYFSNNGNEILNPEYIQSEENLYMNRYYLNLELKERKKINLFPLKVPNNITSVQMKRYNYGHYVIINEETGGFPYRYNKINLLKIDETLTPKSLIKYGDSLYNATFVNSNPNGDFLIQYNEVNLNIYKKTFINTYDDNLKLKYTSDTLNPTTDSPNKTIFKTAHILNDGSSVMLHEKRPDYEQLIRKYYNNGNPEYEFTLMSLVLDTAALDFINFSSTIDNLIYLSAQYAYRGYKWDQQLYPLAYFQVALYVIGDPANISEEHIGFTKFQIYPNPSSDYIDLDFGEDFPLVENDIQIFNLLGERVLTVKSNHNTKQRIDISALKSGTYFVRYGIFAGQFIKFK